MYSSSRFVYLPAFLSSSLSFFSSFSTTLSSFSHLHHQSHPKFILHMHTRHLLFHQMIWLKHSLLFGLMLTFYAIVDQCDAASSTEIQPRQDPFMMGPPFPSGPPPPPPSMSMSPFASPLQSALTALGMLVKKRFLFRQVSVFCLLFQVHG